MLASLEFSCEKPQINAVMPMSYSHKYKPTNEGLYLWLQLNSTETNCLVKINISAFLTFSGRDVNR